jgi:hypothetical protein
MYNFLETSLKILSKILSALKEFPFISGLGICEKNENIF